MIKYEKISLFDKPGKVILTHAVNCQGVMGSGIAKEFKARFPEAFKLYNYWCVPTGQHVGVGPSGGSAKIYPTNNPEIKMGCLFTSYNYGVNVDHPEAILVYTRLALQRFLRQAQAFPDFQICSNKFNSGLFNVPWPKTEALIIKELEAYPGLDWTVCDPNLVSIV